MVEFIETYEEELVELLGTWIGKWIKWGGNIFLILLTGGRWIVPMVIGQLIIWIVR